MRINPNSPTFPITESGDITIRAHFAILLMQALLTNPNTGDSLTEEESETPLRCAELAVEAADALIQVLNK